MIEGEFTLEGRGEEAGVSAQLQLSLDQVLMDQV